MERELPIFATGTVSASKRAYKVKEVAVVINISESKAYELVKAKDIPSFKVGSAIRVGVEDLNDWVRRKTQGGDGHESV